MQWSTGTFLPPPGIQAMYTVTPFQHCKQNGWSCSYHIFSRKLLSLSDFLQGCWAKYHLQTGEWMSCKWCHWFETERGHDVGECSWCWVFSKGFWSMRHDWMTCVFFKSWVGESWIVGLLLFLLDVCGLRTWLSIFSADAKIIMPILSILRAVSCTETGMLFQPWALLFGSLKPFDVKINN